ncbi:MAG: transposase [Leptospiraceae bacterium]|nr:transposase [Leptospiraceae bacterium]
MRYSIGQWDKLVLYFSHGEVYIDNNLVENAIRPFVLGRKNWLFSGSPVGAFLQVHSGIPFFKLLRLMVKILINFFYNF